LDLRLELLDERGDGGQVNLLRRPTRGIAALRLRLSTRRKEK